MYKRVLCTVILVSFLNSILGCTKIVTVPMDEARVPLSPTIVGVVLLSGAQISFNESGGTFDPKKQEISGVRENGEPAVYKLRYISSIQIQYNKDDRSSIQVIKAEKLRSRTKYVEEMKVVKAELNSGDETKFNKDKGKIDYENQAVVGISKEGDKVSHPFDDVAYLRVPDEKNKPTTGKILAAYAAGTAIMLLLLLLLAKTCDNCDLWGEW